MAKMFNLIKENYRVISNFEYDDAGENNVFKKGQDLTEKWNEYGFVSTDLDPFFWVPKFSILDGDETIIKVDIRGIMAHGSMRVLGPWRWNNMRQIVHINMQMYENDLFYHKKLKM